MTSNSFPPLLIFTFLFMADAIPFRDAYEHMKYLPGFDTAAEAAASARGQNASQYESVAASQTAQVLGATGATGDFLLGLLIIPATSTPGLVTILDNAISMPVFVGGASSVSNLVPFFAPLGVASVSGAWKVTTGANVSVIAVGSFT